jgi:hypothetical protein
MADGGVMAALASGERNIISVIEAAIMKIENGVISKENQYQSKAKYNKWRRNQQWQLIMAAENNEISAASIMAKWQIS